MVQKVIVCTGCPASGKSTWATQALHTMNGGRWVRVNRDDFRAMLNGGDPWRHYGTEYEKGIEVMSVELRNAAVRQALMHGFNVIVDEVNIRSRCYEDVKMIVETHAIGNEGYECEIEEKIFYISLEEAKERNAKRNLSVDEDVLEKIWMALGGRFLATEYEPKKATIKWGTNVPK